MTRQRSIMDRIDRVCAWLFLVPFFVMMLIPASVMPTRGADGQMVLVICTGDGPVTMDAGAPVPEVRVKCDWAMGHAVAVLPAPDMTLRPSVNMRVMPAKAVALWRPSHDTRSVNARGPPAIL